MNGLTGRSIILPFFQDMSLFDTSVHLFFSSFFRGFLFLINFANRILEMPLFSCASSTFHFQLVLVFLFHFQIYTCGINLYHGLFHHLFSFLKLCQSQCLVAHKTQKMYWNSAFAEESCSKWWIVRLFSLC